MKSRHMVLRAARFHRNCRPRPGVGLGLRGAPPAVCRIARRRTMGSYWHHTAMALALVVGAGAAQAQTVITREITTEPVETIVERGPTGTVITRRPLDTTVPR